MLVKLIFVSEKDPQWPQLLTWIDFNPSISNNYIHYKVWDEITCPFSNFHGVAIEDWEWISNFFLHFTWHVITYLCWN